MAAPELPLVEFQGFLLSTFGRVGHVAFMRLFHAIHAACRSPSYEYLPEERTAVLVVQTVDREYLLAVNIGEPENGLDGVETLLELALVKQHHHVAVVDDGLFNDFTADDVLYLLCHNAHAGPELTGRLVHELDVLGHQRTGNGFPGFLDDKHLAVLLDSHLLQEHVHDYQRDKREQQRIILYTVNLEHHEGLVEQRTVHVLVQGLFMVAAPVEVLHHVAVSREVYARNVVLVTDVRNTLDGVFVK